MVKDGWNSRCRRPCVLIGDLKGSRPNGQAAHSLATGVNFQQSFWSSKVDIQDCGVNQFVVVINYWSNALKFPELYGPLNPTGPMTGTVEFTEREAMLLRQALVTIVWRQHLNEQWEHLGTGFIVGVSGQILILTATHLFTDMTDRIYPARRSAIPGNEFDREEFNARFLRAMTRGHFAVVIDPPDLDAVFCPLSYFSLPHDATRNDSTLIQVDIPQSLRNHLIAPLLIDTDPPQVGETVAMAGIPEHEIRLVESDEEKIKYIDTLVEMSACRVAEYAERAEGYKGIAMWAANSPMRPGTSGGPVIRLRKRNVISTLSPTYPVAIGIISRSRIAQPILLGQKNTEQTWFTPMTTPLNNLSVRTAAGEMPLGETIESKLLLTFQTHPECRAYY